MLCLQKNLVTVVDYGLFYPLPDDEILRSAGCKVPPF